jgi:hypothetical protein
MTQQNINYTTKTNKNENFSKMIKDIIKDDSTIKLPENYLYNYTDLMTNLKLLSYVKEHDKLTHTDTKIEIDTRYYLQGVRRWFNGDSRDETLKFIERIVKSAEIISEELLKSRTTDDKYNLKLLTDDLISCKNGIYNVKITYNHDKLFVSTIDNLIEKIKIRISKNQLNKLE